ncbi:MAG: hypothetical protein AB7P12_14330 [Alphaproteobacteria bacterium]
MLNVGQFRLLVVRPVLTHLALWSTAAENLLLGTALQESGLRFLRQRSNGPARGIYQIDPAIHDEVHAGFLAGRPALETKVTALLAPSPSRAEQLVTNLAYATAMARVIYLRCPEPLPADGDVAGLGRYWKRHFHGDTGSVPAFVLHYREFIA